MSWEIHVADGLLFRVPKGGAGGFQTAMITLQEVGQTSGEVCSFPGQLKATSFSHHSGAWKSEMEVSQGCALPAG